VTAEPLVSYQGVGFGATRTHLSKGVNELSREAWESFLCGDIQKDLHSSILDFLACHITPTGVTLNSVTMRARAEVEARASDFCSPRFRAF
jgi:hypothetical protein